MRGFPFGETLNYEPFTLYIHQFVKNLSYDSKAKMSYEMLSGGLTWSDELVDLNKIELCFQDNGVMHNLWAYRSSLIKEEPMHELKEVWEQVKKNYPNWPGFRKERADIKLISKLLKYEQDSGF